MFRVQPIGSEIQYSFGQKKGAVRIVHPISGSLIFGPEMRRRIICSKAARDPAPFFSSNTSQASDRGRVVNLTKVPPPATWLNGRLSLNRKGAPGSNPTKGALPLGCQKFTSSAPEWLKNSNQSLSVTPSQYLTAQPPARRRRSALSPDALPGLQARWSRLTLHETGSRSRGPRSSVRPADPRCTGACNPRLGPPR